MPPIDSNIALQGKLPELDNPLTQYAKVAQIQNFQNQNKLFDLTYQEKQRAQDDQNALTSAIKGAYNPATGKVDDSAVMTSLAQSGSGHLIQGYKKTALDTQKTQADIGKTTAEAGKAGMETGIKSFDTIAQTLGALQNVPGGATAEHVTRAMLHLSDLGIVKPDMVAKITSQVPQDPQQMVPWLQSQQQAAMSAKEQVSLRTPDANTVLHNNTLLATNAATVGASRDNAAMVDARAREAGVAGKMPSGYRHKVGGQPGELEFIPGGPADPAAKAAGPASEDERKAAGWVSQADQAWKNMREVMYDKNGKLDKGVVKPGTLENAAAGVGLEQTAQWARSDKRQRFVHGASSMSEALLRAATGAGVNIQEAKQKIEELTPGLNDTDALIDQKMAGIPVYLDSLKNRAGRALPKKIDLTNLKPGEREIVMADAERIGKLRNNPAAGTGAKPSLSDIFGK